MITVVPLFLTAPTDGNIPFRTCQRRACSAASCVKRAGSSEGEAGRRRVRDACQLLALVLARGLELGEEAGGGGGQRAQGRGDARLALDRAQGRPVHDLQRLRARRVERDDGGAGGVEIGEEEQARVPSRGGRAR